MLGVATFEMIRSALNWFHHPSSRPALQGRLSALYRDKYIDRRRIPRCGNLPQVTIYALKISAARVLAEKDHQLESMRLGLPKPFFVKHEMSVTRFLHKVAEESLYGLYKYEYQDSNMLKKNRTKGTKTAVPDLRLTVMFRREIVIINIEIDLGTVLSSEMIARIAEQTRTGEMLLIVCTGKKRLANLKKACKTACFSGRYNVFFILLEDFVVGGFKDTALVNIDNKSIWMRLDYRLP